MKLYKYHVHNRSKSTLWFNVLTADCLRLSYLIDPVWITAQNTENITCSSENSASFVDAI